MNFSAGLNFAVHNVGNLKTIHSVKVKSFSLKVNSLFHTFIWYFALDFFPQNRHLISHHSTEGPNLRFPSN